MSAVVTAFQCEAFLAEAVRSVLGQSVPPDEVLVVDDGSTDGTAAVARSFGERVRVVERRNGGPGAARNTGLAEARGEWIAFLDGDDAWLGGKTEAQLDATAGGADLVFGFARNVKAPRGVALDTGVLDAGPPIPGLVAGAMLARREAFARVGPFPENLSVGEFVDWHARACEAGIARVVLPEVVLLRRIHGGNRTLVSRDAPGDYVRVLKAALDRRRAAGPGEQA